MIACPLLDAGAAELPGSEAASGPSTQNFDTGRFGGIFKLAIKGGYELGRSESDSKYLRGLGDIDAGGKISYETQCLRMITSGVFDRFPRLQIIIGHMGEGLPFFYKRIVEKMSEVTEGSLEKPFEQCFHDKFWFTVGAFSQDERLDLLLKYIGADRVMFAIDYPFANMKAGTDWFRAVDLPRPTQEKIAFRNAEKLFRIKV